MRRETGGKEGREVMQEIFNNFWGEREGRKEGVKEGEEGKRERERERMGGVSISDIDELEQKSIKMQ